MSLPSLLHHPPARRHEPRTLDAHDEAPRRLDRWDWLGATALALVAWSIRRDVLPSDGLWHDDAWVAAGTRAPLGDLLLVGNVHPGFTVLLDLFDAVFDVRGRTFALPVLAVGVLGPAALYLLLRRSGHDRVISALLGGALVTSTVHVTYSGRVKQYVLEAVVVFLLLALLPWLVRRRWDVATALGWLVGSLALASLGSFALIAASGAGAILVLHARGDRPIRVAAVAAQAVLTGVYLLALMGTFDAARLSDEWGTKHDAYLDLGWNPFAVLWSIGEQFLEVVAVFPGGWEPLHAIWVALAVGGLVVGARRPQHRIQAQYSLLLLGLAIVGAGLHRVPFGASQGGLGSTGSRASLWLIGPLAVGIAVAWTELRRVIAARTSPGRRAASAIRWAGLATAALLIGANLDSPAYYPLAGSHSAGAQAVRALADDGTLLVVVGAYNLVADVGLPIDAQATPEQLVGYQPRFLDPRIRTTRTGVSTDGLVGDSDQVVVYSALVGIAPAAHDELASELRALGLRLRHEATYHDTALVAVWRR